MKRRKTFLLTLVVAVVFFSSCSSDGGGDDGIQDRRGGADSANFGCNGDCPNQNLTVEDVTRIIRQGIAGADNIGVAATIVVLDRVSNVLAAYRMPGALTTTTITSESGAVGGLEGVVVPSVFGAISKAGTASNFSSQGNAFNTRSANQLLQENYLPGEKFQPSGPLFGVQFSQGLCSDVNPLNPALIGGLSIGANPTAAGLVGPRPLPLGFAADPGSVSIYKMGDMVGSIGVELDGVYTRDPDLSDKDDSMEERVAMSAAIGFEAPSERVGPNTFIRGKSVRFTELRYSEIAPLPEVLPALVPANLLTVPAFTAGVVRRGAKYATAESGFVRTTRGGVEVEILVGDDGANRFPVKSGAPLPGGVELKAAEVDALLTTNMVLAARTRAQVRRPLNSSARVAVWIVDTEGTVLGYIRSKDTIVDSTDVTLQKARTAVFFSSADAAAKLRAAGAGEFVDRSRSFFGPDVFTGKTAWSTTALGNISRPFFPDGVSGNEPGPLSLPIPELGGSRTWSIFNTGIQLDLFISALVTSITTTTIPDSCTDKRIFGSRLRNGLTFFAGGFPLYRGGVLIGAISSSGDGTEQDDLIPFYGASRKGLDESGFPGIGGPVNGFNAPKEIRADTLSISFPQTNLRYVVCPEGPFLDTNEQNVCGGL